MQLSDILRPDCVRVTLKSSDREAAIEELSTLLGEQAVLGRGADIREAVWTREQKQSTGIGRSVAIPHGKLPDIDGIHMAVGLAAEPMAFKSLDGQPVKLIFLLISPTAQTGQHIQALASISKMLTDPERCEALLESVSAEALFDMITA